MTELFAPLIEWFRVVFIEQFNAWVLLGFVAQACFTMRFVVQWIASERAKRSVVPIAFWFFSLFGGGMLFIYAIQRQDPVFRGQAGEMASGPPAQDDTQHQTPAAHFPHQRVGG